jgi:hypothetical protein
MAVVRPIATRRMTGCFRGYRRINGRLLPEKHM